MTSWSIASPGPAHEMDAAVHYREPRRNDIVLVFKPASRILFCEAPHRRAGDKIHLSNGVVSVNGVAQPEPAEGDVAGVGGYTSPIP